MVMYYVLLKAEDVEEVNEEKVGAFLEKKCLKMQTEIEMSKVD